MVVARWAYSCHLKSSNYHNEENSSSPTHLQTGKASAVSPDRESSTLCAGTGQVSANIDGSPVSLVHNNKHQHSIASPVQAVECSMINMPLAAGAGINGTPTFANTRIDATELQMQPVKPVLSNASSVGAKHTTVESNAQEIADVFARVDSVVPLREKVEKNVNDDFVLVQRKKKRTANKFVGLPGRAASSPSAKFKSADIKIPLFINNVDKQTSEQDIINYIAQKTNTTISLKKINTSKKRNYNAYKVFVPYTKLQLFLNDGLWPEGVTYRRFVYIKKLVQ